MLKKALKNVISEKESNELISAFDQIGEIIIVRIPDSLLSKKKIIGKALLNDVKIVRSVFYQASAVSGDFRTRDLEILAGEDNTETDELLRNKEAVLRNPKALEKLQDDLAQTEIPQEIKQRLEGVDFEGIKQSLLAKPERQPTESLLERK